MSTAIVSHGSADGFWERIQIPAEISHRVSGKIIVSFKGRVQFGDIPSMVFAMVDFHGAGIDGGFKVVKVVPEGRKFVSHSLLQNRCAKHRPQSERRGVEVLAEGGMASSPTSRRPMASKVSRGDEGRPQISL